LQETTKKISRELGAKDTYAAPDETRTTRLKAESGDAA